MNLLHGSSDIPGCLVGVWRFGTFLEKNAKWSFICVQVSKFKYCTPDKHLPVTKRLSLTWFTKLPTGCVLLLRTSSTSLLVLSFTRPLIPCITTASDRFWVEYKAYSWFCPELVCVCGGWVCVYVRYWCLFSDSSDGSEVAGERQVTICGTPETVE